MEKEILIKAFDGSIFNSEQDCKVYEQVKIPMFLDKVNFTYYFRNGCNNLPFSKGRMKKPTNDAVVFKNYALKGLSGSASLSTADEVEQFLKIFENLGYKNISEYAELKSDLIRSDYSEKYFCIGDKQAGDIFFSIFSKETMFENLIEKNEELIAQSLEISEYLNSN